MAPGQTALTDKHPPGQTAPTDKQPLGQTAPKDKWPLGNFFFSDFFFFFSIFRSQIPRIFFDTIFVRQTQNCFLVSLNEPTYWYDDLENPLLPWKTSNSHAAYLII